MKKHLFLAGLILFTAIFFFSSCSSDDENPDLPPSISFVVESGFLTDDAILLVNTEFKVKVLCSANVTSGSNIKSLRITRVTNNQFLFDTTLSYNNESIILEVTFNSLPEPGVEVIEFTAADNDGQKASIDIEITTEEPEAGEISTFTMRVLGSYLSSTGSSFASINGMIYTLSEAYTNQTIIDFLYWWGGPTDATIGAPDDENANALFTGANGLPDWSVKNGTRFKVTTLTKNEFDAVSEAGPCIEHATGADQTHMPFLTVDKVIAFITVTGKHGLIKVVAINQGVAGDITIDVKVQK